jgi:hypothetical protein
MSDTETNVSQIRRSRPVQRFEDTATIPINPGESTFVSDSGISFETVGATARAPKIDIDRLYETLPGTASQMVRALELLRQAIDFLSEARTSQDAMDSDRFVQRAQLLLPKLFACRSIGDGFGLIINSLHFAFTNLHGTPLNSDQLNVVWRTLRELRTRPAMSLEQGIQHAEELETSGLEVDPPGLGEILEGDEAAQ